MCHGHIGHCHIVPEFGVHDRVRQPPPPIFNPIEPLRDRCSTAGPGIECFNDGTWGVRAVEKGVNGHGPSVDQQEDNRNPLRVGCLEHGSGQRLLMPRRQTDSLPVGACRRSQLGSELGLEACVFLFPSCSTEMVSLPMARITRWAPLIEATAAGIPVSSPPCRQPHKPCQIWLYSREHILQMLWDRCGSIQENTYYTCCGTPNVSPVMVTPASAVVFPPIFATSMALARSWIQSNILPCQLVGS